MIYKFWIVVHISLYISTFLDFQNRFMAGRKRWSNHRWPPRQQPFLGSPESASPVTGTVFHVPDSPCSGDGLFHFKISGKSTYYILPSKTLKHYKRTDLAAQIWSDICLSDHVCRVHQKNVSRSRFWKLISFLFLIQMTNQMDVGIAYQL